MSTSTLILGGARSGKSTRALALAQPYARKILIATAEARDDEMTARIAAHRAERDAAWETHEQPLRLAETITRMSPSLDNSNVVVIDCLTLWLSNQMHTGVNLEIETENLVTAIKKSPADIIIISNELGLGLVPDTKLGRDFRDEQGRLNQRFAAAADIVEFVAAGIPLRMKP